MNLFVTIVIVSLLEACVSFVGGLFAIFQKERIQKITHFLVSFAVGALLGVSFFELIPEAIEGNSAHTILPFVFAGILLFFILEKFLFWYHCHGKECPVHTYTYLILWGDMLHNFIDGVIITLAFLVDIKVGIAASLAVIFHEIPQEISDFSILLHGGLSFKRAFFYNFLVALSVIVGALITYVLGEALIPLLPFALALIAGNFIYLASTDLMPELHEKSGAAHSIGQIFLIVLGALLVVVPEFLI